MAKKTKHKYSRSMKVTCTECKAKFAKRDYCPNCGASMIPEAEEPVTVPMGVALGIPAPGPWVGRPAWLPLPMMDREIEELAKMDPREVYSKGASA